jgi:hypothetical protein
MATKTQAIAAAWAAAPASSDNAGLGYQQMNIDRAAIIERIAEEHMFELGTTPDADQGRHKAGSAVAWYQATFPTKRPDGVTALDVNDTGRILIDSYNAGHAVYVYVYGLTGGYSTLTNGTPSGSGPWYVLIAPATDPTYDSVTITDSVTIDEDFLGHDGTEQVSIAQDAEVVFHSVTVEGGTGDLIGRAWKIRTSAPAIPADGDIWIA